MHSRATVARIAGLLYLVTIFAGIFSLMYVPSHIYVRGDAAATADSIVTSQNLYRWGILVGAIGYVAFALLPLALYKLLAPTSTSIAVCMVVLALLALPIDFLSLANQLDLLTLLTADKYKNVFAPEELHHHVSLLRDAISDKIIVSEIFWGLWLFPYGLLTYRCGFLPKTIGVALMLGAGCYMATVSGEIFSLDLSLGGWMSLPASIGEIGGALWLLIVGPQRWIWRRTLNQAA